MKHLFIKQYYVLQVASLHLSVAFPPTWFSLAYFPICFTFYPTLFPKLTAKHYCLSLPIFTQYSISSFNQLRCFICNISFCHFVLYFTSNLKQKYFFLEENPWPISMRIILLQWNKYRDLQIHLLGKLQWHLQLCLHLQH